MLDHIWKGAGSAALAAIRNARVPGDQLWSFNGRQLKDQFARRLAMVPGARPCVPYQLRHGAASHASALLNMSQAELQSRLRHTSEQSTLRYARHVRYLAEVQRLPREVLEWADVVDDFLPTIVAGGVPPVPSFLGPLKQCIVNKL